MGLMRERGKTKHENKEKRKYLIPRTWYVLYQVVDKLYPGGSTVQQCSYISENEQPSPLNKKDKYTKSSLRSVDEENKPGT